MPAQNERFWQRLDQFLGQKGLKQTNQRKIIADCMLTMNRKHFDAEELHGVLRTAGHDIGLATIYRTLNLLKDAGLVNHKVFSGGSGFFEVDEPDTHHDHLFCSDCGRVIEFESDAIEKLQAAVAKKYGFELTDHRLDLWGKCVTQNCKFRKKA